MQELLDFLKIFKQSELGGIEWLDLCNKSICKLPKQFERELKNLRELNISENNLTNLPIIEKLEWLEIACNKITKVPECIYKMEYLTFLDINHNQIQSLPDSIGTLKHLECLYASHNQIQTLPDSIGKLKRLDCLVINNNQIQTLPDSFGKLKRLTQLNISENPLKTMPWSIGKLDITRFGYSDTGHFLVYMYFGGLKMFLQNNHVLTVYQPVEELL